MGTISQRFFAVPFLVRFCADKFWSALLRGILPRAISQEPFISSLLQGKFSCTFSQVLFPWVFFRGDSFLFRGSVLPCSLSQRRCPWAQPREVFPCDSLQWFFGFFACTLWQGFFSVRPFAGVFSVCFAAQIFVCPQSRDYSRTLFRMTFPVGSFTGISCLNSFAWTIFFGFSARVSSMPFFAAVLSCALSQGEFASVSRGQFFGALFVMAFFVGFLLVVFSVSFSEGVLSAHSFAKFLPWAFPPSILSHGRFPPSFLQGRFQCASSGGFFVAFFSGVFSVHSLAEEISMGYFVWMFPCAFLQ